MTKAQLTLTSLVATLLCLVCFAPGVAQAAFTHKFEDKIEPFGRVVGVGIGPSEPKPAAEKGAVYVADHNRGVVERFSAAGAKLPFTCGSPCATYVSGNVLEGTPAEGLQQGRDALEGGVAVNGETGEFYVSDSAVVDVFAPTGEFLGQIKGPETPCMAGEPGCANPGTDAPCKAAEAGCVVLFTGTVGLAFDQNTHELYVGNDSQTVGVSDVVDVFAMEAGGVSKFKSRLGAGELSRGGGPSVAVAESGLLEGTVYVGERIPSGSRVYVFGQLGTLEASWTGAKTPAKSFGVQGLSVAIDPSTGNLFVFDGGHGIVDEFPGSVAEEKPLGTVKGTPTGPGGLLVPFNVRSEVAVVPASGDLYVGNESVVDQFGRDLTIPDVEVGPSPTFTIEPATHTWSATLNGRVDPDAAGPATCEFEYGTSTSYGRHAKCSGPIGEGNSFSPVHSESGAITGLPPGTTYFYRLDATNDADKETNTGQGAEDEGSFITPGPIIEQASASDVASSSATLNVTVNPNDAPTSVHFEYGRCSSLTTCSSSAFESSTAPEAIGSADSPVAVEPHVQVLEAGAVYHYRAVVSSEIAAGVSEEFYGGEEGSFTTQSPGTFSLPDARQWEMVSPPAKEGALVQPPGEPWGVTQAAAQGTAMTWLANVPTEPGVVGYANSQQVLSTRAPGGGWSSVDLASPHNGAVSVSVEAGQEYRFFNEDLTEGILQPFGPFQPCHNGEGAAQPCFTPAASEQTAFVRDLTTGLYTPLVTGCLGNGQPCEPQIAERANVPEGTVFGRTGHLEGLSCPPEKFCGPYFDGASPDAKHIVFHSLQALKSDPAPEECNGGLYEWNTEAPPASQLQRVSILPDNGGFTCTASLGVREKLTHDGANARHAVSDDGSRVFWTRESGGLYMRDVARGETIAIGPAGTEFQTASSDGSRVFFTAGGSLFECEIPEAPTCAPVLLGEAPRNSGSVIGSSVDGSYVYWVAGNLDLYMDHDVAGVWKRTLVAALSSEDLPDWAQGSPQLEQLSARVSPGGEWLAFMSERELTGYDNRDAASGHHDEEVYLYHAATGALSCASCDPTGARPVGSETGLEGHTIGLVDNTRYEGWEPSTWLAADVPGWVAFEGTIARYQPRYLSNEGRLFFGSDSALVPKDINGTWDVYEYEPVGVASCTPEAGSGSVVFKPARGFEGEDGSGEEGAGCVGLLSSGESGQESVFLDASESGGDVFFMTTSQLAKQDFDHAYDVYDAHECSSGSPCPPQLPGASPECTTAEACRAASAPPPGIYGAPPSATFNGLGNLTPSPPPVVKKVTKKAAKCAKGKVRNKKGKCVPKKKSKKRAKKASKPSRGGKS
jgi:hypothetical protein